MKILRETSLPVFNLNDFFLGDAGHFSKSFSFLLPFPISDCDKQLFGPQGEIVNPVQLPDQRQVVCRTFINVPPRNRIAIRALYIDLGNESNQTHFNYILVSRKPKGDSLDEYGPSSLDVSIQMQNSVTTPRGSDSDLCYVNVDVNEHY